MASMSLMPKVRDCVVRGECYGASDHLPLVIVIEANSTKKSDCKEISSSNVLDETNNVLNGTNNTLNETNNTSPHSLVE